MILFAIAHNNCNKDHCTFGGLRKVIPFGHVYEVLEISVRWFCDLDRHLLFEHSKMVFLYNVDVKAAHSL